MSAQQEDRGDAGRTGLSRDDARVLCDRVLELSRTHACAEGLSAFLEKRAPVYHEDNPVNYPRPDETW